MQDALLLSFELVQLPIHVFLERDFVKGHLSGLTDGFIELDGFFTGTEDAVEDFFFQWESVAFVQKGREAFLTQSHGGSWIEIDA